MRHAEQANALLRWYGKTSSQETFSHQAHLKMRSKLFCLWVAQSIQLNIYKRWQPRPIAVQMYTALVYGGTSLAAEVAQGLDQLLARDGFTCVADAVGTGRADWN